MNPSMLQFFLEKGLGPVVEKLPSQETFSQKKKKRSLGILNRLEKSGNFRKMLLFLVIFN